MADRTVYLVADPVTAYRVVRDKQVSGEPRDLAVSALRSALPDGTGVQLRIDDADIRTDAAGQLTVPSTAITPDRIGRAFQPWHVDVEPESRARWKGYLDPEYNLTLVNLVGAITPDDLERREVPFVATRLVQLEERPVLQTFDLDHLRQLHAHVFQDVYPWAGETRTVNMQRPGGPTFAPWDEIKERVDAIAALVRDQGFLRGLASVTFADQAAVVYHGLNETHAFREGNGRTQRLWMTDLARGAGYTFDWQAVHRGLNDRVSLLARQGNIEPMRQMFADITTPKPAHSEPRSPAVDEGAQARRDSSAGPSHLRLVSNQTSAAQQPTANRSDLPYGHGPSRRR